MDGRNEYNTFLKFQQKIYSIWNILFNESCQVEKIICFRNLNIYIYTSENDVQKLEKNNLKD